MGGRAQALQNGPRTVHGLQANEPEFPDQRFELAEHAGKSGFQLEVVFEYDEGLFVAHRPFP